MASKDSAMFPAPHSPQRQSGGSATGSSRNKVALPKGRSLMDWIRLGNSGADLTGVGGQLLRVSNEQLKEHNSREDCWMAIAGRVYNITQYCEFHPGGISEIMRGAGIDATNLFNQVHRWVNYESMLQKCLVGKLVSEHIFTKPAFGSSLTVPQGVATSNLRTVNRPQTQGATSNTLSLPFSRPVPPSDKPRFDFFQNEKAVKVTVYTRTPGVDERNLVLERPDDGTVKISVYLPSGKLYRLHILPFQPLLTDCKVRGVPTIGKIEVDFPKANPGEKWTRLGKYLPGHNVLIEQPSIEYINCVVSRIRQVTHDTKMLTVSLPEGYHMVTPIGCHIHTKADILGTEIVRSYTPIEDITDQVIQSSGNELPLFVKLYADGALSPIIDQYEEGSKIPISHWTGSFKVSCIEKFSHVLLLGAGTGITPHIKLINHSLNEQKNVHVIFFNKQTRDIPFRNEFDEIASSNKRFTITHALSEPDSSWTGETGRLTDKLLQRVIQEEDKSNWFVAVCGPKGFNELAQRLLSGTLADKDQYHIFDG